MYNIGPWDGYRRDQNCGTIFLTHRLNDCFKREAMFWAFVLGGETPSRIRAWSLIRNKKTKCSL
jgi:hypothetical protein